MEDISDIVRLECIKSYKSTIKKTENALEKMSEKRSSTTLINKRLKAFRIGLAILENVWNNVPHGYNIEDLKEAKDILTSLLPSIEKIYTKTKEGSPQKTLLARRVRALELSIKPIEDLINK